MLIKIKSFLFVILLTVSHLALAQTDVFPEKPNPPRLVTDFTLTLTREETTALEQKLKAYADSTSSQIAIVVVKDIGDYDISQYAPELAMKWGIGQKGKNNGLLILWATGPRKIFIATGYGMEEKVPDAIAKRIVNQLIIPNFKLGQYYQGLNLATDEIIARMSGQFVEENQGGGEEEFPFGFFVMMLIFMIILFIIIRKNGGRGNRFNDRNRGGFGGGLGGGLPWIISNQGGSSWGSGGDWGGGDSGGGFGGFGGGDFGGGGAGGDY